jgi:hypothetical protein
MSSLLICFTLSLSEQEIFNNFSPCGKGSALSQHIQNKQYKTIYSVLGKRPSGKLAAARFSGILPG